MFYLLGFSNLADDPNRPYILSWGEVYKPLFDYLEKTRNLIGAGPNDWKKLEIVEVKYVQK